MRRIYSLRNRYAVPSIAALLVTLIAAAPVEGILLPHHQAAPHAALFIGPLFHLATFVWCFAVAEGIWRHWLDKRPELVVLRGSRDEAPGRPATDGGGKKTGTR